MTGLRGNFHAERNLALKDSMANKVPISEIKAEPNRRVEDVASLARSIQELGLLQPIILSPGTKGF